MWPRPTRTDHYPPDAMLYDADADVYLAWSINP